MSRHRSAPAAGPPQPPPDPPRIHVVVPVYNNERTVRQAVIGILEHGFPVVVVDDGSSDGSAASLAGLDIEILSHGKNLGKGAALQTAARHIMAAGSTHMICFDGDGQFDPADLGPMVAAVRANPHAVVYGIRRFEPGAVPGSSVFGRRFANFWVRVTAGKKVLDSQCGFRAYPVASLLQLKIRRKRYDFEVEALVRSSWAGLNLVGVPVSVTYQPPGGRVTHFRPIVDNARISLTYTRLVFRAMLPVPPPRLEKGPDGSLQYFSPWHPVRFLRSLLEERSSPLELAAAAALGLFVGTLPLFGIHTVSVIFAASLLRLNRLLAFAVSNLCAPPFVPALCVLVGYRMRHGAWLSVFNADTLWHHAGERLWEYVLGTLVLAPLIAVVGALITFGLAFTVARFSKNNRQAGPPTKGITARYGTRFGIGFMKLLIRFFGLRFAYFCLWFVVPYYIFLRPAIRRSAYPYLKHRFPGRSRLGLLIGAAHMVAEFSKLMIDQAVVRIRGADYFTIDVDQQPKLQAMLEAEPGIVLIMSHIGNWKAMISTLEITAKPVNLLLVRDPTAPTTGEGGVPEVLGGARIIDPTGAFGGLVEATTALMRGEIASIMGDRSWGGRTIVVDLFGDPAHIPVSPYRLARSTGARVLTVMVARAGHRRYRIFFRELAGPAAEGEKRGEEFCTETAKAYVTAVEEFLADYPYSWFNFYDFWQAPAPPA